MTIFISYMALFYVIVFVLSLCSFTFAAPTEIMGVTDTLEVHYFYNYTMRNLLQPDVMDYIDGGQNKTRVKRQGSGGGKYSDAASMGPMKVIQLFFTFTRNIFTTDPIGGVHPMSRTIPGPVVQLLKGTIIAKLFPDLNRDH